MDFPIHCECGRKTVVSEGAAGCLIPCDCGRILDIPSLGKLRMSVGLPAVDVPLEMEVWFGTIALAVGIGLQWITANQQAKYQRRLRSLLSKVPFYERVFERYPDAIVEVH